MLLYRTKKLLVRCTSVGADISYLSRVDPDQAALGLLCLQKRYLVDDTLLMIGKIFKPWWLIIPFDVLIFRCRRFRLDCDKLTI